jgi:hypothetical protein
VSDTSIPLGPPRLSPWAPLRHQIFRTLWIAQFASNIGTWTQTVGAQWLMGSLGGGPLKVALVQTATTLPFSSEQFHLVCPWHGWEFDVLSGVSVSDPRRRLRKLRVEERDGGLYAGG